MNLLRNIFLSLLLTAGMTGCSSRPNYYPEAFEPDVDESTKLLDETGQEVNRFNPSFSWTRVATMIFRGTKLKLKKATDLALDSIRVADGDDTLKLPVGDKLVRITGWRAVTLTDHKILIVGGHILGKQADALNSVWLFNRVCPVCC